MDRSISFMDQKAQHYKNVISLQLELHIQIPIKSLVGFWWKFTTDSKIYMEL